MGKIFLAAIHHPGEIDVIENFGRQENDLRVVAKTRASSENTGQENCRVDRGYLTIGCPGSCLRVHKMVKPAVFARRFPNKKLKRRLRSLFSACAADPAMFLRNAVTGQREARSRNACDAVRFSVRIQGSPVERQARLGVCLFTEVKKRPTGDIVDQIQVRGAEVHSSADHSGRNNCRYYAFL